VGGDAPSQEKRQAWIIGSTKKGREGSENSILFSGFLAREGVRWRGEVRKIKGKKKKLKRKGL